MNATKRAQVPFGLRKKLMAATSMLLVAAIMLVSTSYAWFTLSTAPEITGITTSVGANGNLEIALLTTETFTNTDAISSGTGDSMENTANAHTVKDANITWGNLVDLSQNYGLESIVMYPSMLNSVTGAVNTLAPLGFPKYGADGRVTEVAKTTITAIYDEGAFTQADGEAADYGVRAVGTSSNVSARALILRSAKGAYQTKVNSVATPIRNAVHNNFNVFLTLAGNGSSPTSYTYDQVVAMGEIAKGVQTSLNNIVSAYANATIAKVAADTTNFTEEQVVALSDALAGQTNAATIAGLVNSTGDTSANDATYVDVLNSLATQQAGVADVIAVVNELTEANTGKADYTATSDFNGTDNTDSDVKTIKDKIAVPLLGANLKVEDASGAPLTSPSAIIAAGNAYLTEGIVGGDAGVAHYNGSFFLAEALGVKMHAGKASITGVLSGLTTTVTNYTYTDSNSGPANISDFYGYVIDFAFRTNAANSKLQLQTAAVNRVYSDAEDVELATQGGGSTISFDFAGVTASQATNLLEAVRVVFFNPDDGTIYKTAKVGNVTTSSNNVTGELYLIASEGDAYTLGKDAYQVKAGATTYELKDKVTIDGVEYDTTTANFNNVVESYTETEWATAALAATSDAPTADSAADGVLGKDAYEEVAIYEINTNFKYNDDTELTSSNCTNYVTEITATVYNALKSKTFKTTAATLEGDKTAITDLSQNIVLKMSALVYLDGENIDNSAVAATGTDSGDLKLNLQFSSSAELTPMENSDLRTELKNAGTNP